METNKGESPQEEISARNFGWDEVAFHERWTCVCAECMTAWHWELWVHGLCPAPDGSGDSSEDIVWRDENGEETDSPLENGGQ